MGWTVGHLQGPFTARAAIEFDLGAEFAARVIDTARYGQVIYAAVRSSAGCPGPAPQAHQRGETRDPGWNVQRA